jgi:PEGA domain
MAAHTITVNVDPEGAGAKVLVAGQPLQGSSITLTETHGYASVAVTAPGYFPFRKLVELKGSATTITVALKPMPSKRRKPMPFVLLAMVVVALVKLVMTCR